ncbi:MAG: DNA mismatch repair endonuclease MutL [Candidatus Omnitrophica bacterium]|nr:DNA mismatch repair endonuclease MutL [Candidatus Omnitrophota bacterium]
MGDVRILPPEIISKIAAGEVIERPASVVKELIENSLDAKASSIELHIKQAGKTLIQIKDNGSGIAPDDMNIIFHRHATSKIRKPDDLYSINSLGFRGEALYSICAISDIFLRSKMKNSEVGWEIHIRGSQKISLKPINMPIGTEIEIRELFFNTPARRKFLKSDSTEIKQILNTFIPYTLLYPHCSFLLTHGSKTLLDLLPQQDLVNRISNCLNLNKNHIITGQRNYPKNNLSAELILGDINIQRAMKNLQFIFVNNRPVQNRSLNFHINQIYKLILPSDVYSFFILFINVNPDTIDVNIHPSKREIKLKDEQIIISLIRSLCEQTLMTKSKPKQIEEINPFTLKLKPKYSQNQASTNYQQIKENKPLKYILSNEEQINFFPNKTFFENNKEQSLKTKLYASKYVGSFIKKYILFETIESLLIVDQHAAQERISYEALKKQIESGSVESQHLLSPIILSLSPQEMITWENIRITLENIGFSNTLIDNENIAIHSHPQLITNPAIAVRNLLSEININCYDNNIVARWACRNSIKAGYTIDYEQANYLKNELLKTKDPFICPHGRPTVIEIKEATLDKEFIRR